jgi:hypothetical protein
MWKSMGDKITKQNEYFEKVITWKKKPDWGGILLGIIIIILCFLNFLDLSIDRNWFLIIFNVFTIIALATIGTGIFLTGLGKERKVMWRKMK